MSQSHLSREVQRSRPEKSTLLFGLYDEVALRSKPLFKAKIPVIRSGSYPELQLFRQQIESAQNGICHQPYTVECKKVTYYRTVFLGFSFIFLALSFVLFFHKMSWPFHLYAGILNVSKTLALTFSLFLSAAALLLGLRLHPEKDAAAHLARKAKQKLAAIYTRKNVESGLRSFFAFGLTYRKSEVFRQTYKEIREKINEKHEHTLYFMERIAEAKQLNWKTKEELFNQALLELDDKLHLLVHTFRSTKIDHLIRE